MPHGAPVSNETTVLSMHTMLGDASLDGVDVRLELRLGAETSSALTRLTTCKFLGEAPRTRMRS